TLTVSSILQHSMAEARIFIYKIYSCWEELMSNLIGQRIFCFSLAFILVCSLSLSVSAHSNPQENKQENKSESTTIEKAFERLEWRSIGPANMSGRVADIEGVPGNPNIVYVGSASGGVWKTTNAGITWTPIFERQGTLSI